MLWQEKNALVLSVPLVLPLPRGSWRDEQGGFVVVIVFRAKIDEIQLLDASRIFDYCLIVSDTFCWKICGSLGGGNVFVFLLNKY